MNNKAILKLACQIIGIFFLFQGISQFKAFALYAAPVFMSEESIATNDFYRESGFYSLFVSLSGIAFDLAIALFLFFKSEWIVNRFDRSTSERPVHLPMDRVVLIELTVIAVGIFVFARALPNVLTNIIEYLAANKRDIDAMNVFWNHNNRLGRLIFSGTEVIVGIVIASNGRSMAKRFERVGDINAAAVGNGSASNP
jgi:hypothetical protein